MTISIDRAMGVPPEGAEVVPIGRGKGQQGIQIVVDPDELRRLARERGATEVVAMLGGPEGQRPALAAIVEAAVSDISLRVLGGEFPFKDAGQAVSAARMLFDMGRTLEGKLTTEQMTKEDRDRRLQEIRDAARPAGAIDVTASS